MRLYLMKDVEKTVSIDEVETVDNPEEASFLKLTGF